MDGREGNQGSAYNTSPVCHRPGQLLIRTDNRASEDDGDELDLGVLWMQSTLIDGTVCIVWEGLGVSD